MSAKDYAIQCHADANHLYDGLPYAVPSLRPRT